MSSRRTGTEEMCRFRGFYLCDVVGLLLRGKEATRKRMEEIAKQPGHITPRAALNQLQVLSMIYTRITRFRWRPVVVSKGWPQWINDHWKIPSNLDTEMWDTRLAKLSMDRYGNHLIHEEQEESDSSGSNFWLYHLHNHCEENCKPVGKVIF